MRSRTVCAAGILAAIVLLLAGALVPAAAQSRTKIRYALGDIVTVESLPLLIDRLGPVLSARAAV